MSWPATLFRTILTSMVGVVTTLIAVPIVMTIAAVNDSSPWIDRVIRMWSRVWLAMSGTHMTVIGSENIDPEQSYVVVANHLSILDIMACFLTMAIASGLPVLPMTIHGTYEAWRPGTLWVRGGHITTVVDAPILTTGLMQQDSGDLTKQAYEIIAGRVGELGGQISFDGPPVRGEK